jgi:hypothetical protein
MSTSRRFVALGVAGLFLAGCGAEGGSEAPSTPSAMIARQGLSAEPDLDQACARLADPSVSARMSGALESALAEACGISTPKPEVRLRPRVARRAALAVEGVPNIAVSDPSLDIGGSTQSETSVVAHGDVVCAAWNDSGEGFGLNGFSGFGYSLDGGATFQDGGAFPSGPADSNYGDPALAYSVRDGSFYYAALSDVGLSLWKSSDSCQSFSYVGPIHRGFFSDDKELIAIDNAPDSPFYGRLYVGWTDFAASGDQNVAAFTDDGGLTWSDAIAFPGSGQSGQGVYPAVAPNGDVYMAFVNLALSTGGLQDQWIYRSTDGGQSWTKLTIAEAQLRPEDPNASDNCGREALNGDIRLLPSPQIAIHADPNAASGYVIHAVYNYDADGSGPDASDVFYRRSEDAAESFSDEVRLNDDTTTTDQFVPAVAVGDDGTVVASWYDRRLDPTENLAIDRYATTSLDGGLTWVENQRLSDVSSPVGQTNPHFDGLATCYHGDYDQVAISGSTAHVVWSDDRREDPVTGPNPDVYYQQYIVNPARGRVRFQPSRVSCDGQLSVRLSDSDLSGNGAATLVLTTTGGDLETLTLEETPDDPGEFNGSIALTEAAAVPENGALEVHDSEQITATYEDADGGDGTPRVATAEATVDCIAPEISNVRATALGGDSATIVVDSSEPARLTVDYGSSCNDLALSRSSALSGSPGVRLEGLYFGATYFYAVTLTDSLGNESRDDNSGACYSFTTLVEVYSVDFEDGLEGFVIDNEPIDPGGGEGGAGGVPGAGGGPTTGGNPNNGGAGGEFDSDPGEAFAGDGAGGEPSGGFGGEGGGGNPGPNGTTGLWHLSQACAAATRGHSLSTALYFGIDATCMFDNGNRSHGVVTSPVIELADASAAVVEFAYFLGGEDGGSFDRASLEVSVNGGAFEVLESNFTRIVKRRVRRDPVATAAGRLALIGNSDRWQHASVDLTPLLGDLPSAQVQLRFRFDTRDSIGNEFAGFYVDDVRVLGLSPKQACSVDADCDDGLFCNGSERCQAGFCARGAPVLCESEDAVDCTDAVCDEATRGCVERPNDDRCDDATFCNGFETCDATLGCQAGPPPCEGFDQDDIECTGEVCRENIKFCTVEPLHFLCDDGLFCTGEESCDPSVGCVSTGFPCGDGVGCTRDTCSEGFGCESVADDSLCNDGLFCNGSESCDSGLGCRGSGDPCPGPDTCDEGGNQCIPACFTDTNANHRAATRAYSRGSSFFAKGSNDSLGKASHVTSLQGGAGFFERVESCPAPPSIESFAVTVSGNTARVTGTASDVNHDIQRVRVTLFVFGDIEQTFDAAGTESFSAAIGLPIGVHAASVQAFDRSGLASAPSEVQWFEVFPPLPPTIESLEVSVSGDAATLSGTAADPNADLDFIQLAILKDGAVVASTIADGLESWSGTIRGLAPGSYEARAQAFDASDLVSDFSLVDFSIQDPQTTCVTARNSEHLGAERARYSVRQRRYLALGSNDSLGANAQAKTSLSGSAGFWKRVPSCP